MLVKRKPPIDLDPYVHALWTTSETEARTDPTARERVLPDGGMHLVFVLSGEPLAIYRDANDAIGRGVGPAVIGGARSTAYVRNARGRASTVGVQFRPGAAARILGIDVDELGEAHTSLHEVWGRAATELQERLAESRSPEARLAEIEAALRRRIELARTPRPWLADALNRLARGERVGDVAREAGCSHRHFVDSFRRSVGVTPKVHARVKRLERALDFAQARRVRSWSQIAFAAGYSDQSHLNREFRQISGMTPSEYGALVPLGSRHVPLASVSVSRSDSSKT